MNAFYDGDWQGGEKRIPVICPFSGEILDEVPSCDGASIDRAFDCLEEGARKLRKMEREELHAVFDRLHRLLLDRRAEFAELISREQGKPIMESRLEVESCLSSIEAIADNPSLVGARILPLAVEASVDERFGYTLRHPHGIVAVISPNSQPMVLPVVNAIYALAAGNAVLLKPSVHTPLVVLRFVELLLEAGVPPEAIACLTGKGSDLGPRLVAHPKLDHLVASGSLSTIRSIRGNMGFLTNQMQWGCVATCVVGKSADIEMVRDSILEFAFECSGQAAFTPTWIGCFEQKYGDLRDALEEGMNRLQVGDPLHEGTRIGPLAEEKKVRRLEGRIADEIALGAKLVTGGRVSERTYQPMLLEHCDLEKSRFPRKEIPAPIIGMTPIRKATEATRLLAEQRHHVLTLFSSDIDWASRQAVRMPFNNVHINGIPNWRDGLICLPGHPVRTGRRTAEGRVSDMSHIRDVIFH